MAKRRVHEIAKDQGLTSKELLGVLAAAGVAAKTASSSVEETLALAVLAKRNGAAEEGAPAAKEPASPAARKAPAAPATARPPAPRSKASAPSSPSAPAQERRHERQPGRARKVEGPPVGERQAPPGESSGRSAERTPRAPERQGKPRDDAERQRARPPAGGRPRRDMRAGERAPGGHAPGGRRRVVIDSQASRRAPSPGPQSQPQRRPRRGRRRRGAYTESAAPLEQIVEPARQDGAVRISSGATVKDIAEYLDIPVPEVIKRLMALGEMATLTKSLSDEAIELLAEELGRSIEIVHAAEEAAAELEPQDRPDQLVERAPVVTIMGHVDHGKTSLLDAIRESEVADSEAGGITQHIGAYQVTHAGRPITFLDTPGHEAFTAMRARGARVTDVAVIVVAADDGVKPQTEEAIDHAKAAGVPIVVAVNKIDKEGAAPERVRGEMAQHGLQPVAWGGDVEFVDVSAKTKQGLDTLLDTIQVVAELAEIRANPDAPASGTVIESKLDPGRGPVVTILVQRGTLNVGDALVAGIHHGRVRAMHDWAGGRVKHARPGEPVEVLGFSGVPEAGESVRCVESERRARQLAAERELRLKSEALARRATHRVSLEDVFKLAQEGAVKELNLVLKADVAGSLEAIEDEIARLPQAEVAVRVLHRGVGGINESDVMLAAAAKGLILAFNVRPVGEAAKLAERQGVEIRTYSVIYRAIEELKAAMQGMLEPEEVESVLGRVEVRQLFRASRIGTIAGSYIAEGSVRRGARVRVVRDGTVVAETTIASLRRFNEDVTEVAEGFECGIVLQSYQDLREGDVFEVFETRTVARELA
ncbi:MAG TPA: translation initiation factor IF-2 [Solirubrobacteraceae bacterium]|nr:translation initiation factor IF-2 [Solirubrobacteraceae bacterium]